MKRWRAPRRVQWGGLRSTQPVSRCFGEDRGLPVCRYYIERFLRENAADIQGDVLEVENANYTRRFGDDRVTRSHVLHVVDGNPLATLVGDLTTGEGIPTRAFDCIVLTQTLPFIYDVRAALYHVERSLKPGGMLLATFPGISQISRYDMDRWGDFWRFTDASARRLFEEFWPAENLSFEVHGNVLVATAYLQGIASDELREDELDFKDQDYPLLITVRARKP
jgi:hypothetical protein